MAHSSSLETMYAFANWASCNQRMIAHMRVSSDLSYLCSKKFQIAINETTLANWDQICVSWMCELIQIEEEFWEDPVELEKRKRAVFMKYFGESFTRGYEREYSMHHDAYQMRERMRGYMTMIVSV